MWLARGEGEGGVIGAILVPLVDEAEKKEGKW